MPCRHVPNVPRINFIQQNSLEVEWILETHAHADHLSAAPYIQDKVGGKIAIGENIRLVQDMFAGVFNLGPGFQKDGSQFDKLFADGETFQIGELTASVIYTPGHTPACVCSFGFAFYNLCCYVLLVFQSSGLYTCLHFSWILSVVSFFAKVLL